MVVTIESKVTINDEVYAKGPWSLSNVRQGNTGKVHKFSNSPVIQSLCHVAPISCPLASILSLNTSWCPFSVVAWSIAFGADRIRSSMVIWSITPWVVPVGVSWVVPRGVAWDAARIVSSMPRISSRVVWYLSSCCSPTCSDWKRFNTSSLSPITGSYMSVNQIHKNNEFITKKQHYNRM